MFYKQIVMHKGLPFEVKIPEPKLDFSQLSTKEIDNELNKGYQEYLKGESIPAECVFAEIRKKYEE